MHSRRVHQSLASDTWLLRLLVASPASGFEASRSCQRTGESTPGSARDLYVAFHRLERDGLVAGEWRRLPGCPHDVRRYRTTARGRRVLGVDADHRHASLHPLTVLVLLALWGRPATGESVEHARPARLTIVVSPQLRIAPHELRQVSIEVNRILGAVGIRAEWVFEPARVDRPRSTSPEGRRPFLIHATLRPRLTGSPWPEPGEMVLGITTAVSPNGADIVLWYDQIAEFSARTQQPLPWILGLVIAHEIGHVLLPSPAHADTGIMQAPWDRQALERADQQALLFTARQGALMRDRLRRESAARD